MTASQKVLYDKAVEFEQMYPNRGFHVTQREWYNEAFEIRASGATAQSLVKAGKLRVSVNAPNGMGRSRPVYHVINIE